MNTPDPARPDGIAADRADDARRDRDAAEPAPAVRAADAQPRPGEPAASSGRSSRLTAAGQDGDEQDGDKYVPL